MISSVHYTDDDVSEGVAKVAFSETHQTHIMILRLSQL